MDGLAIFLEVESSTCGTEGPHAYMSQAKTQAYHTSDHKLA
jgi:hypothetical protein